MSDKESIGLTKKDFATDQIVRWCPGCGDYAILAQVQALLPELGRPPEQYAFVSGIGCAARFPYYMNTYGFHTIHGRAPAIATGLKADTCLMSDKESIGLTKKDFATDQIVRWCPGCGDYAILAQVQALLPELGRPPEQYAFVSGIGCAARFPYYMNTYGFHTIHGRAPAIATGLKASNPELSVWVVTGDGDALSIGGNHLIHAMRRNVDLKLLLFDNRVYGLTKGQYSPTSRVGQKSPSTPWGSIDNPLEPVSIVLAAEATFVARTVDRDLKHMKEVIRRAAEHRGIAFVHILQNCPVFFDGVFKHVTDKEVREDNVLYLEHGQPMVYGKNRDKGLRLRGGLIEV